MVTTAQGAVRCVVDGQVRSFQGIPYATAARFGDRRILVGAEPGHRPRLRDDRGAYVRSLTAGAWQRADFVDDHQYLFWRQYCCG